MRLSTTQHGRDEERVVAGRRIRELYPHLQRALQAKPHLQSIFAEPRFASDHPETHWHTAGIEHQGLLSEQTEEVQEAAKAQIRSVISEITALAEDHRQRGETAGHDLADVLESALMIPSDDSVRIVDGKPVLVGWGRTPLGEAATNTLLYDISDFSRMQSGDAIGAGGGDAPDVVRVQDIRETAATMSHAVWGAPFWLHALLWGLSALAFLLLLWLYLANCAFLRLGSDTWLGNYCAAPTGNPEISLLEDRLRQLEREYYSREAVCRAPANMPEPVPPPSNPEPGHEQTPAPQETQEPAPEGNQESTPLQPEQTEDRVEELGGEIGSLNVVLSWGQTDDLDLYLDCPSGDRIYHGSLEVCGGKLDVDTNFGGERTTEPVENIVFSEIPADGSYTVRVRRSRDDDPKGASTPFKVELFGDRNGERVSLDSAEGEAKSALQDVLTFTLPLTP